MSEGHPPEPMGATDMELDSLMQTHCMVPIPEWGAYMQYMIVREQGANPIFLPDRDNC